MQDSHKMLGYRRTGERGGQGPQSLGDQHHQMVSLLIGPRDTQVDYTNR